MDLFRNVYLYVFYILTSCIAGKLECSDGTMNWNAAQDFCMKRGGEIMMSGSSDFNQKHEQVTGQWMGLRRQWRLKTVNKQGK